MNREFYLFRIFYKYSLKFVMKCVRNILIYTLNVMFQVHTCNILNLFCVEEYVGGLGQLFCFPRKIVKFPIHFCLDIIILMSHREEVP
jgi:hypothetical protein